MTMPLLELHQVTKSYGPSGKNTPRSWIASA